MNFCFKSNISFAIYEKSDIKQAKVTTFFYLLAIYNTIM